MAAFTLNTYQWLLPGMQAEAAATFQLLLANPEPDEHDHQAANDGPWSPAVTGPCSSPVGLVP